MWRHLLLIPAQHAPQGALGDCWIVSALALLAERPALLRALLPAEMQDVDHGVYTVRARAEMNEWPTRYYYYY